MVGFTGKFADKSGIDRLVIDYSNSIVFHGVIQHVWCFFSEVPRIEESQDPDSSPRRGEVGRPTLRDYGGFLLPFFCRDRFQLLTSNFLKLQKLPLTSLQTLWEY